MKTIVVRKPGPAIALERSTEILASVRRSETLADTVLQDTTVSVEDLSEGDKADLEADPDFLTANAIPLQLIRPLDNGPAVGAQDAYSPYVEDDGQGGRAAWGIVAIGAAASAFTGQGVPVAVLDTGIDPNHPAFGGVNLVRQNFTSGPDDDTDGHGTHCAGTIFGRDVDGVRIGVAPGVTQALIAKVIPAGSDALVDALNWVFSSGAKVASMSLGYDFPGWVNDLIASGIPRPAAVSMALRDFRSNIATFDAQMGLFRAQSMNAGGGMVVVAASGNESGRGLAPPQRPYTISASPPSAAVGVIAVGALRRDPGGLEIAPFSNTSPQVSAPGVGVLSARAGGRDLVAFNGTSMACPHVAGLAALYWDQALHGPGGASGADTVAARLVGRAQTATLNPGFRRIDVGEGLPAAP